MSSISKTNRPTIADVARGASRELSVARIALIPYLHRAHHRQHDG